MKISKAFVLMNKLLMVFVLAFTSYNSMAAWTFLYPAAEDGHYMDLTSIRKDGNFVKVWTLIDIKKQEIQERGIYSLKMQTEFNCKDETFRILNSIAYLSTTIRTLALSILLCEILAST